VDARHKAGHDELIIPSKPIRPDVLADLAAPPKPAFEEAANQAFCTPSNGPFEALKNG
jgi:hypothetical protein